MSRTLYTIILGLVTVFFNTTIHTSLGEPMPEPIFRIWSAFLIGFVVFKFGWNSKKFTNNPEDDL
ncbi:MAG: hypothetical protein CMQ51_00245 [Gammaproteobacteria bacterium]|nr:hypothetical protein [Gammaproteobacteria bacterium]HAJ06128.1 hypothetical protein [Chloroflexota bacterium]HCU98778.1 hypothetical protein [Chloroflexota bacterium]